MKAINHVLFVIRIGTDMRFLFVHIVPYLLGLHLITTGFVANSIRNHVVMNATTFWYCQCFID
uniref:Uncharacterized protein n=1 Tax=Helianthus annuus TaxID=4232 RepID=A0A251SU90_HELAN